MSSISKSVSKIITLALKLCPKRTLHGSGPQSYNLFALTLHCEFIQHIALKNVMHTLFLPNFSSCALAVKIAQNFT